MARVKKRYVFKKIGASTKVIVGLATIAVTVSVFVPDLMPKEEKPTSPATLPATLLSMGVYQEGLLVSNLEGEAIDTSELAVEVNGKEISVNWDKRILAEHEATSAKLSGLRIRDKVEIIYKPTNTVMHSAKIEKVYQTAQEVLKNPLGTVTVGEGEEVKKISLIFENQYTPIWSYKTRDWVTSVAISPGGSYIAAGSLDKKVYLFSRWCAEPLWAYDTGDFVLDVAISSGGHVAAASGSKVFLLSKELALLGKPLQIYEVKDAVTSVAISKDGSFIAAGSLGKNVYLFSAYSSKPIWTYEADDLVTSVAISDNGSYIAAGSLGTVYLFSKSGKLIWSYDARRPYTVRPYVAVSISSEGDYVAAGAGEDILLFSRQGLEGIEEETNFVTCMAISPDGSHLVNGFADYAIQLYSKDSMCTTKFEEIWFPSWGENASVTVSVPASKFIKRYWSHGETSSVAISSCGKFVAAGCLDNKLYIFSKDLEEPLFSYGVGDWVSSVSMSYDGFQVAAGSCDNRVYFFSRGTKIENFSPPVKTVIISADGAGSPASEPYLILLYELLTQLNKSQWSMLYSHILDKLSKKISLLLYMNESYG